MSLIGDPDSPPFSFFCLLIKFSLSFTDVLVKTNPSKLNSKIFLQIISISSSLISGDIFRTIGVLLFKVFFIFKISLNNFFKFSCS